MREVLTWNEVTAGDIVEIDGKLWGVMRVERFEIKQNSTIPWYVLHADLRSTADRTNLLSALRSPHETTHRVGHVRSDAVQRGDEGWADLTAPCPCCGGTGNRGSVVYPIACPLPGTSEVEAMKPLMPQHVYARVESWQVR